MPNRLLDRFRRRPAGLASVTVKVDDSPRWNNLTGRPHDYDPARIEEFPADPDHFLVLDELQPGELLEAIQTKLAAVVELRVVEAACLNVRDAPGRTGKINLHTTNAEPINYNYARLYLLIGNAPSRNKR